MTKNKFKKLLFLLILIILFVFCYHYINRQSFELIKDKSFFSDFKVENDNTVYITALVTIKNNLKKDTTVYLVGSFPHDYHFGLLKNGTIHAQDDKTKSIEFILPAKKESQFSIVFIGEYGGVYQKYNRCLPDITIIPKN